MKTAYWMNSFVALALTGLQATAQTTSSVQHQTSNTMQSKKVLFVVTNASLAGNTGKPTGLWLEEFTTPYYALSDQGIQITIASPKGGAAPVDPKSELPEHSTSSVQRFNKDAVTREKLKNTLKLDAVNAADYDAIFYPGGHGPMWDLPTDPHSIQLISSFYEAGKPVALVCHAPAVLQNVKASNGEWLMKGKKVTGYSNSEETVGASVDVTPWSLEDMLKERGAQYSKGGDWQPYAVQDGLLITGQNPASAGPVAEKLLLALSQSKASR